MEALSSIDSVTLFLSRSCCGEWRALTAERFVKRGLKSREMCPTKFDRKASLDNNLERLKEAFAVLDRDGDGIIASTDLEVFLQESVARKLISKEDVQNMLAIVDGNVDLEQFLRLLQFEPMSDVSAISRGENSENALRAMFLALDKNGDGLVCEDDLKSIMFSLGRHLSVKDIGTMLHGPGSRSVPNKVTYEEFVAVMTIGKPANNFYVLRPVQSVR